MLPNETEEPLLSAGFESSHNSSRRPRWMRRSGEQQSTTATTSASNRSKLKCSSRTSTINSSAQSNRSSLLSRAARGSQLIENFSEFLASRNVINRYSRYDKIVNSGQQQQARHNSNAHHRLGQQQQTSAISPNGSLIDDIGGSVDPGGFVFSRQVTASSPLTTRNNLLVDQPVRFLANHGGHCCGHQHQPSGTGKLAFGPTTSILGGDRSSHLATCNSCCCKKKARQPLVLLRALLSRKQKNKTSLLLSLLRAPIVLAALFSLLLALSLLVLYTLSFLHNYNHHQHHQSTDNHSHSGRYDHSHAQDDKRGASGSNDQLQHWLGTQLKQSLKSNIVVGAVGQDERTLSSVNGSGVLPPLSHHVNTRRHLKPRVAFETGAANGGDSNKNVVEPPVASPSAEQQWATVEVPYTTGATTTTTTRATNSKEASKPAAIAEPSSSSLLRALTVQTECGALVGVSEGGAIAFKGIAYASPPVGRRRWTRPRPIWLDGKLCQPNKTLSAGDPAAATISPKPYCAQLSPVTRRFSGHEDCLYLDVYAPQLDQVKKLPVMVYIHGGFLAFGSSGHGQVNWMKARPSAKLASELNVVLVAFNYRLQALGFMTLLQFAQNNGPDGSEGNYGLWDQLAALNWIKRNIESFGGDPNNIVLFGPDSASALPLALMSRSTGSDGRGASGASSPTAAAAAGSLAPAGSAELTSAVANGNTNANQAQEAATATLYSRDLFRAAWLTNPTVYYELPYELASQHYQRLFLNQKPCSSFGSANNSNRRGQKRMRSNSNGEIKANVSASGSNFARAISANNNNDDNEVVARAESASGRQQADQTLECLMGLSSEQVVRHYFGKDDPAYRLDDQDSLPIHGIFADQFVTVDRELVHDSYPFGGGTAGRGGGGLRSTETATQTAAAANAAVAAPAAVVSGSTGSSSSSSEVNQNASSIVQEGAAHYQAQTETVGRATLQPSAARLANEPARDKETSKSSGSNYDDNCVGPICAPAISALNQAAAASSNSGKLDSLALFASKDLLLGSTAQAVEYWPCPRNLDQWNWQDFERYVATSLNSFITDTYKRASELYKAPKQPHATASGANADGAALQATANNATQTATPKETYLSMVSDIRQICPINELAVSMEARKHRVQRYVVETRPDSQSWSRLRTRLRQKKAAAEKERRARRRDATEMNSPAPPLSMSSIGAQNETAYYNEDDERESGPEESATSDEEAAFGSVSLLAASEERQIVPEFAFHTWDLIAFLGFEFEPDFEPSAKDLEFQSEIRQMVMSFVHRSPTSPPQPPIESDVRSDDSESDDKKANSSDRKTNEPPIVAPVVEVKEEGAASSNELVTDYTLFSWDGSRRQIRGSAYKSEECNFWHKHLGRSYAWVS